MNKATARAKRDEQPPSTPGTSAGRARLWPLAVSVLALGIVATVASVASAGTVGESVQTTAQLAAAAKTPEARPAKPVVQAPKVTTFA